MRPVEDRQLFTKEEVMWMEAERQVSMMKAKRQAVAVELVFQISDWLHIGFRLASDSFQTGSLIIVKTSDFRLVQIGSDLLFIFHIGFRFISDCSLKLQISD